MNGRRALFVLAALVLAGAACEPSPGAPIGDADAGPDTPTDAPVDADDNAFVSPLSWPACTLAPDRGDFNAHVDAVVDAATVRLALLPAQAAALRCLARLPGNRSFEAPEDGPQDLHTPGLVHLELPFPVGDDFRTSLDAFVAELDPLIRAIWGLTDEFVLAHRLEWAANSTGGRGVTVVYDLVSLRGLPIAWSRLDLQVFPDRDAATGAARPGWWRLESVSGQVWRDLPTLDLDPAHFVPKEGVLALVPQGMTVTAEPVLALVLGRPRWGVAWEGHRICGWACSGGSAFIDALSGFGGPGSTWDGLCPTPDMCPDGAPLPDGWFNGRPPTLLGPEAAAALLGPRDPAPCTFPECDAMDEAAYQAFMDVYTQQAPCEPLPAVLPCQWKDTAFARSEFEAALIRDGAACGGFTPEQQEALRCLAARSGPYVQGLGYQWLGAYGTPQSVSLEIPVEVPPGTSPLLALLQAEGPTIAAAWSLDANWDLTISLEGDLATSDRAWMLVDATAWHGIPFDGRIAPRLRIQVHPPWGRGGGNCNPQTIVLGEISGFIDRRIQATDPDPAHGIDATAALAAARIDWPLGDVPLSPPVRVLTEGILAWRVDFPAPFPVPQRCYDCGGVSVFVDVATGAAHYARSEACPSWCLVDPDISAFAYLF